MDLCARYRNRAITRHARTCHCECFLFFFVFNDHDVAESGFSLF